jgi:hypothetical protein
VPVQGCTLSFIFTLLSKNVNSAQLIKEYSALIASGSQAFSLAYRSENFQCTINIFIEA